MTSIKAYPRLHIGLIDMGNATLRKYGGAGFALNYKPVEVSVSDGPLSVTDLSSLDASALRDIDNAIDRFKKAFPVNSGSLIIRRRPPQHVGLGTKTALTLAVLKAYQLFSGITATEGCLQKLSARGGASGVGIHSFFRGGFIVDAGHKAAIDLGFNPSRFRTDFDIPSLNVRVNIPKSWRFALFLPNGRLYSGGKELRFFQKNTPIPKGEIKDTMALMYHGIVPAVVQDDVSLLKFSLEQIHRKGFKRRELDGQTGAVNRLFCSLAELSQCAVGMSSMGPLVYTVQREPSSEMINELRERSEREGAQLLGICAGRNRGFQIS